MVAAKFLDDVYCSNKNWAEVGGIPNAELNNLETEFLFLLSFNLYITREEYDTYASPFSGSEKTQVTRSASEPSSAIAQVTTVSTSAPSSSRSSSSSSRFNSTSPANWVLQRVKGMGTKVSSYTNVTIGALPCDRLHEKNVLKGLRGT